MPHPRFQGANALINPAKTSLALLLAAALVVPVPVFAAPSTKAEKMALARSVKSQIDRLNNRLDTAQENYDEAAVRHNTLLAQTRAAQRRVRKATARIGVLQLHLGTRASDMYRTGPLGFLDVLLGTKSFDELASMWDVLKALNRDDATAVAQMKAAKAEAAAAHADLAAKEKDSAHQVAVMRNQTNDYRASLAARNAKLKGIQAEVAAIEAAQQAAELAASRRGGGGGGGGNFPNPTIPAHGTVVQYARSRIGCRYVWAGSGPRVFDCSGLTMWCYRQIGISLPHSSRGQINCGQRVSKSNIQPGDLVFFGSPIHHVGLYIGGGMMIHSPHTGSTVQVAPAFRGDYAGACRP